MSSNPVWTGTWFSRINTEAHGTISIPKPLYVGFLDIKIVFEGQLYNDRMMIANGYHATGNEKGAIGVVELENKLSLISYKVTDWSDDKIEGYYACSFPYDHGIFILSDQKSDQK